MRHGDQTKNQAVHVLVRLLHTDVAREQARDGVVHRADVLRGGGGEHGGRLDHLAQVQAHAVFGDRADSLDWPAAVGSSSPMKPRNR